MIDVDGEKAWTVALEPMPSPARLPGWMVPMGVAAACFVYVIVDKIVHLLG